MSANDPTSENVPLSRFTGSEFEAIVKERCVQLEKQRLASIGRYGVSAARTKESWVIHQSLPDFEGITADGRQVIFDAKVCSQASFPLHDYRPDTRGARSRQLTHMLKRSQYAARCFFLIHWNRRELKTKQSPPVTYAFPVELDHPFWQAFLSGEVKILRRADCESFAVKVDWTKMGPADRRFRPDVLGAVVGCTYRETALV